VEFEFERCSNSNSKPKLFLYLFPKPQSPAWADNSLSQPDGPTNPTGPVDREAPQPNPPTLFPLCFSFAYRWGHLVSHRTLIPLTFFLPAAGACSPGRARTRALDGTVARPPGLDAESPRARGLVPVGRGFYPSALAPRSPEA
jgi:hypothetical protein